MNPYFFKAKSRLGLVNPPYGSKNLNIGVEEAPDIILDKTFLSQFKNYSTGEFTFSKPESVPRRNFFKILAKELKDFSKLINKKISSKDIQVVIGGDDSVTFSSLLAVLERANHPLELGYIRFDSHADMNLFKSSPTKNFHGMYHRAFFDKFDKAEINNLVKYKLNPKNVLFIGNLDLDAEEKNFFRSRNFENINSRQLQNKPNTVIDKVSRFVKKFKHLHVSFDIDCLDFKDAPATGIPAKGGLPFKSIYSLLEIIGRHRLTSIDLVEVNPRLSGAKKTVGIAQEVLRVLL